MDGALLNSVPYDEYQVIDQEKHRCGNPGYGVAGFDGDNASVSWEVKQNPYYSQETDSA